MAFDAIRNVNFSRRHVSPPTRIGVISSVTNPGQA
jgi:hypothetical protein